jgi:hypothetical protein
MIEKIIEELKNKRYSIKIDGGDHILPPSWRKDIRENGKHLDYDDVVEILNKILGEKE